MLIAINFLWCILLRAKFNRFYVVKRLKIANTIFVNKEEE